MALNRNHGTFSWTNKVNQIGAVFVASSLHSQKRASISFNLPIIRTNPSVFQWFLLVFQKSSQTRCRNGAVAGRPPKTTNLQLPSRWATKKVGKQNERARNGAWINWRFAKAPKIGKKTRNQDEPRPRIQKLVLQTVAQKVPLDCSQNRRVVFVAPSRVTSQFCQEVSTRWLNQHVG